MTTSHSEFLIKRYRVLVNGFPDTFWFAKSPGQARAKAWRAYQMCDNCTFKRFMQISSVRRESNVPKKFGLRITVGGEPAYYVSQNGQYVQFVRPGSDQIFNSHPLDVSYG